jgi:integrase
VNRKHITENPKKVFHSFRHNVADGLKQAGVTETVLTKILGHAHGTITNQRYSNEYMPKVVLEEIRKLDYGVWNDCCGIVTTKNREYSASGLCLGRGSA